MTDHTGSSYKGYIGIDQKSGDIAHYGKNFANGDRGGHWDIQIEQVLPGLPGYVVSLKQSTQKGTRWLSANGGGRMGSETQNLSDERFVIMGSREYCRVQRYDNFTAGNDDGYLRAHHLGTDHDQADITADGKPYWTENWTKKKGSGGGGLGQPNLSDHSSEPHSERLTTFYLGLFY